MLLEPKHKPKNSVNPQALEQRLIDRGIDVNTVKMEDIAELEPIVKEEIAALKASALPTKKTVQSPPKDSSKVNKRIEVANVEGFKTENVIQESSKRTVFGKSIFKDGSIPLFEVSKDYVPSDAYILGPGDIITVSIFGKSQADLQFTIKPDGFIEPTNLPKVYLKGVSLGSETG